MRTLGIIGASGHGKVAADIAEKMGYETILFFDDDPSAARCGGYPVVGISSDAGKRCEEVFVAIGNAAIRRKLQESLEADNITLPALIHPSAVIAPDVKIGPGSAVMAGAVINSGTAIGKGCIINTCASVDHDCKLEDYVHVAVGAHLAGTVTVGDGTWIGAGATVINNITICGGCTIGAGAVVTGNISVPGTYIGMPAEEKHMMKKFLRGG